MSENNKISNDIGYKGSVELKLTKGKRILKKIKINNYGTINLFHGLAICLTQQFPSASTYLPNFIGIGTSNDIPDNFVNVAHLQSEILSRVQLTNAVIKTSELTIGETKKQGYSVKFIGSYPFRQKISSKIKEIGLFSTVIGESMLARITLNDDESITPEAGDTLIIEWTMFIGNIE